MYGLFGHEKSVILPQIVTEMFQLIYFLPLSGQLFVLYKLLQQRRWPLPQLNVVPLWVVNTIFKTMSVVLVDEFSYEQL